MKERYNPAWKNLTHMLYDLEMLELGHDNFSKKVNGEFDHISVEVWAECFKCM